MDVDIDIKRQVLRVGDEFSSVEELEDAIKRVEAQQNVSFWKRDSRTIKSAAKRVDTSNILPALKYYSVVWTCVKGGRSYDPKPTKKSRRPRSGKEGCEAFIAAYVSKDGQKLVISRANFIHNHDDEQEAPYNMYQGLQCIRQKRRRRIHRGMNALPRQGNTGVEQLDTKAALIFQPQSEFNNDSAIYCDGVEQEDCTEYNCHSVFSEDSVQPLLTHSQRENYAKHVTEMLKTVSRVAMHAEDADLLALHYYLKGFIQRNTPKEDTMAVQCASELQDRDTNRCLSHVKPVSKKQGNVDAKMLKVKEELIDDHLFGASSTNLDEDVDPLSNSTDERTRTYVMAFVFNKEEPAELSRILPHVMFAGLGLYRKMIVASGKYENCTQDWEDRGEKQMFFFVKNSSELSSLHRLSCNLNLLSCLVQTSLTSCSVLGVFVEEDMAGSVLGNLELIGS